MSNILCIADVNNGQLKKVSKEIVSAARTLAKDSGGKVVALLFGNEGLADELKAAGADSIIVSDLSDYSPEGYATVATEVAGTQDANIILAANSIIGRDFAPRVAAKLGAGMINDVVELKLDGGKLTCRKPTYSGKSFASIQVQTEKAVATVRPNAIEVGTEAGEGAVEKVSIDGGSIQSKFASVDASGGDKVSLTDASIIVSGGRGMKNSDNYSILQELCDTCGAALGASRASVDAGWIDHSFQVGQTGKTVSPNLYIACGISGAIQHLAGMGSSKCIVAINKDEEAPIFKVATYGIVADLFDIVPEVTAEFKKALS